MAAASVGSGRWRVCNRVAPTVTSARQATVTRQSHIGHRHSLVLALDITRARTTTPVPLPASHKVESPMTTVVPFRSSRSLLLLLGGFLGGLLLLGARPASMPSMASLPHYSPVDFFRK